MQNRLEGGKLGSSAMGLRNNRQVREMLNRIYKTTDVIRCGEGNRDTYSPNSKE